jgi:putative lysine transport system substrate-binding protein
MDSNEYLQKTGGKGMKRSKRIVTGTLCAAAMLVAAGSTVQAEEQKTLRVAMECGYAPYNWTQPTDENGAVPIADSTEYAYGYDVMMAKHICEELGYDLEIVKLDWDALVPAVVSGTVDCVIAGQSITSERLEVVDFTEPYYYASIITLTKQDSEYADATSVADLAGATCTSQLNTIWYDTCLPQIPDANILPAQDSAPAMLVALDAGKCDLVVTDMPTGMAALVAYPEFTLLDFTGTDGEFEVSDEDINIGVSLQKGNTELKDAINSVLAEMTVEDFEEMMDEAISVQPLSDAE